MSVDGSKHPDPGPCVTLEIDSRPETPALVRAMISGVAERLSFDPELLDDVKTAVSEACNNVVVHAYPPGQPGPLSLDLWALDDRLVASIRDQGVGITQHRLTSEHHPGVGIPVIRALAAEADFTQSESGGTEVMIVFSGVREGEPLFQPLPSTIPNDGWASNLDGDAVASVSPVELLSGVLGRLARALAATARFSLDRFSDVYLVTDAVAAHASLASSVERIAFALKAGQRRLELTVGPLQEGSGEMIGDKAQATAAPSPLTLLSDELRVDALPGDEKEVLRVVMVDRRTGEG